MTQVEELAHAALARDALKVRSIMQELARSAETFAALPKPDGDQSETTIVAAALLELIASRKSLTVPEWTAEVGSLAAPFHLLASAERMPRLREWCEAESPAPLKRRNLFAPPDYLSEV